MIGSLTCSVYQTAWHGCREQTIGQLDRLAQSGVRLELFSMVDAGAPWNNTAFWADALPPPHEGQDEHSNPFADSEDSAWGTIFRLQVCHSCICNPARMGAR